MNAAVILANIDSNDKDKEGAMIDKDNNRKKNDKNYYDNDKRKQ